MATSEQQHAEDVNAGIGHHKSEAPDGSGGKCLNRHRPRKKNDSCSHIWQAFLRMHEDNTRYNYPAYKSLCAEKNIEGMYAKYKESEKAPVTLSQPLEGAWDLPDKDDFAEEGKNFTICYLPYWHEAHHIVPNSTLRAAIEVAVNPASDKNGYKRVIRKSLLDEKFNINYQHNMVMLPINAVVADGMGLPLHRKTPDYPAHGTYSKHVKAELKKIFVEVKDKAEKHETPDVAKVKEQIDDLSERLRDAIFKTGAKALDYMGDSEFEQPTAAPLGGR